MARSKLQTSNLRAVEVQESERPLYKVYRPAPAAHSNHLSITTPKSNHFLPHTSRRHLAKDSDSKRDSDAVALDQLLAPEFRGDSFSAARPSLEGPEMGGGSSEAVEQKTRPGLGLGLGRKASDRKSEKSSGEHGARRRLTNATTSSGKSKNTYGVTGGDGPSGLHRRISYGRRDGEPDEELSSKALGVYVDSAGKVHDKEYDPFENVRNASRKKVERQRAFGATRSREEDSEVGSDLSGSAVSGVGSLGNPGFRSISGGAQRLAYGSRGSFAGSDRQGGRDDETEVIRRRLMEERRGLGLSYTSGGMLSDRHVPSGSRSWVADDDNFRQEEAQRGLVGGSEDEDEDEDEFEDAPESHHSHGAHTDRGVSDGNRTRLNTKTSAGFSEYDSGYSAASPRMPTTQVTRNSLMGGAGGRPGSVASPVIPNVSRLKQDAAGERTSPTMSQGGHGQLSSSVKTHASILSREERPRALLYPQTPAQAAAAEKKAANKAQTAAMEKEEILAPPIAPFNPAFVGYKQGRNTSAPSSVRGGRRGSGAHAIHGLLPPSHRKGSLDMGKPASTVFSAHEQGYLPSRWASGDKAFRRGEEEIDRYRPLEWSGSQNAQGPAEADFSPGVSEVVKRNWQELKLAFRFGAHRTKKKIERKVQMM